MELSERCFACQKRHVNEINKSWKVTCKGISKQLWDTGVYPVEEILGPEEYDKCTIQEKVDLQLSFNKLMWAEQKIGWTPYHPKRKEYQIWQKEMIMCTSKLKVGRLGRRMGKCILDASIINTPSGPVKAMDLDPIKHELYTFDEKKRKLMKTNKFSTFDNGMKEVYRLETRMGNIDEVTFNHPYLTFKDGEFKWIDAENITVGDRVLVSKTYEGLFNKDKEDRGKFRSIGYLMADGFYSFDSMKFINNDAVILNDFKVILEKKFNCELILEKGKTHSHKITIKDETLDKENKLKTFALKHGLGKTPANKEIPDDVYNTSMINLSYFISSAWDCDGWVDNNSIGYSTSSKKFAKGMKHLLKRFGIQSKFREKFVKFKNNRNITYQIEVRGKENLITFFDKIGLLSKGDKLDKLISSKNKGINNYEMLPIELNEYINKKDKELCLNLRKLYNIRVKSDERVSIDKLKRINLVMNDPFLQEFIDGDFILDEVKFINSIGTHSTTGITVDGTNTFITDDIWTHNTEALCIEALHFIDTTLIKNAHVMIVGPFQNLLDEIFDRLKLMLESDSSVFKGQVKSRKKPYTIQLPNGNKILGFTTGTKSGSEGASTRGQRCDKLFLDEADYMSQKDIETVMALMMEHSDFEISCSSTPQAMPGKFRDWCLNDSMYKDFHYPSTLMNSYKAQEELLINTYNKDGFAREILAEFYEDSTKVFASEDIKASFVDYDYYETIQKTPNYSDYITVCGCDWNSWKNGELHCPFI